MTAIRCAAFPNSSTTSVVVLMTLALTIQCCSLANAKYVFNQHEDHQSIDEQNAKPELTSTLEEGFGGHHAFNGLEKGMSYSGVPNGAKCGKDLLSKASSIK